MKWKSEHPIIFPPCEGIFSVATGYNFTDQRCRGWGSFCNALSIHSAVFTQVARLRKCTT